MERRFFGALPVRRMVVEVVCQIYDVAISNLVRHGRLVCREKQKRQRQTPAYRKCLPPDHSLVTRMWPNASDKNLPINYSTRGGGDLFPETVGIFPEHSQINTGNGSNTRISGAFCPKAVPKGTGSWT